MEHSYVDPRDFRDFKSNTDKLIDILNHNMTKMEKTMSSMCLRMGAMGVDMTWMKKIISWQTGILSGILVAILTAIAIGGVKWLGA